MFQCGSIWTEYRGYYNFDWREGRFYVRKRCWWWNISSCLQERSWCTTRRLIKSTFIKLRENQNWLGKMERWFLIIHLWKKHYGCWKEDIAWNSLLRTKNWRIVRSREPLQINVWKRFWNILKYPPKYAGNISMMTRMEVTEKRDNRDLLLTFNNLVVWKQNPLRKKYGKILADLPY